jgi:hypothetical protein
MLRYHVETDIERLLSWLDVFTLLLKHGSKPNEYCNDPDSHNNPNPEGAWQRQLSALMVVNSIFMA